MILNGQGVDIRSLFFQTPDGIANQSCFESLGFYRAIKKIDRAYGYPVVLILWHVIGNESCLNVAETMYKDAAGVMLCYDIDNLKSFECIARWLRNMHEYRSVNANHDQLNTIKVLVGIKSSVVGDEKSVLLARGEALARKYDIPFREIALGDNVFADTVLEEMLALLEERNSAQPKSH